jgi:CheY-like chemotaxis protein
MSTSVSSKSKEQGKRQANPTIVVFDDSPALLKSIAHYSKEFNLTNIQLCSETEEVEDELSKEEVVEFLVTDYELTGTGFNGVSFLKYLQANESSQKRYIPIIYSDKIKSLRNNTEHLEWCKKNSIHLIEKSIDHKNLFESILNLYIANQPLPDKTKYSDMKNHELLLSLADDLIKDLEDNKDASHFFGGNSKPLSSSELIHEIKKLTPLGKEYLGTWFDSVKTSLRYLERKHLKAKQNE